VPGRAVTSAKSWLCQPSVDRTAPILPWGAPADVARLSPVEASTRILSHLKAAFEAAHPGHPLAAQEVVLTVPASFDDAARALTLEAAHAAGLPEVTLLEEPLAALYHWLEHHQERLGPELEGVDLVLVVDVGGGTTDFTLVAVARESGHPSLTRVAVGDHLLLGGDNADLALAHLAEERLAAGVIDAASWGALVQSARAAKEALLADDAPVSRGVTLPARSSRLVGGTRTVDLTREEVRRIVVDGFFPMVTRDARPERRAAALQEFGLSYAADPAVTRHLAAFLARHLPQGRHVDAVLFNGGSLVPATIGDRLVDVLMDWSGYRPKVLAAAALDLAVAHGAAHYGRVRRGEGLRIGGGSARSYYIGVQSPEGHRALCVAAQGQPEGERRTLPRELTLVVGRPVRFEPFASTSHGDTKPGDVVAIDDALLPLPPLQTVLRSKQGAATVDVTLEASVSEYGTLEVACVSGGARFKLEFQLRGETADGSLFETAALPRRFEEARILVEKFYGKKPSDVDPREVKNLGRSLEKLLGERESWTLPVLRELWSVLWSAAPRRRRSAEHERQWLMLAGFGLRPGFGAALDDWRVQETHSLLAQGIQFHQEPGLWDQWWVFWRRLAGGLDEAAQVSIAESARYWLEPPKGGRTRPRPPGPKVEGLEELARLVASLERVPASMKADLGEWLWARTQATGAGVWNLGRLGSREPMYGSPHQVVEPVVAEAWLHRLMGLDWSRTKDAPLAAVMMARMTGDRARDIGVELRAKVLERLIQVKAPSSWTSLVRERTLLERADTQRFLGESLPAGLLLK
jgi:hypothetical protein